MNLNDRQLYILLDMVQQVCGMRIEKMLERLNHALEKRLKATRKRSVDKYIELLQTNSGEVANFVNVLTINWTFFFRENQHCEFFLENLDRSRYYKSGVPLAVPARNHTLLRSSFWKMDSILKYLRQIFQILHWIRQEWPYMFMRMFPKFQIKSCRNISKEGMVDKRVM